MTLFRTRGGPWRFAPAAALILAALAGRAAVAAPQTAAKSPASGGGETRAQAATQVDGITERVLDRLFEQGDRYWHQGDYNRIVALTRVAVEADPRAVESYANAAYLLWSQGDAPGADAFLRMGVKRNPGRYDLYTEMGQHLFRTKRYSDALPYLKSGTRYKNAPAPAWSSLAHCYERVGRLNDALATWRQIVKRFPAYRAGPTNLRRVQALQQSRAAGTAPG